MVVAKHQKKKGDEAHSTEGEEYTQRKKESRRATCYPKDAILLPLRPSKEVFQNPPLEQMPNEQPAMASPQESPQEDLTWEQHPWRSKKSKKIFKVAERKGGVPFGEGE